MDDDKSRAIRAMLAKAGLIGAGATMALVPLSGGVSCDVWRVEADGQPIAVVKRALAKLRVKADWFAPIERTEHEVRWFRVANSILPGFAPEVIAEDPAHHLFAMTYLPPERFPVWKDQLFQGIVRPDVGAMLGRKLAILHGRTAGDAAIARQFDNGESFDALRVDAFLRHVARLHTDVAPRLTALADDLSARRMALVHGDVSPKNILVGPQDAPDGTGAAEPIVIDAETCVYSDPAFDLAFCLTHLLLKIVHLAESAPALRQTALLLAQNWVDGVTFDDKGAISKRAAALASGLLLARIDGKSPAPYIRDRAEAQHIRQQAIHWLRNPADDLEQLVRGWN